MKVAYKDIFTGLPIYLGLVGDEPLGLLQQQLPTCGGHIQEKLTNIRTLLR